LTIAYNIIHNLSKMSRKQSAKDILKTIGQDSSHQSKSSTSTPKPLPTLTHRTHKRVICNCLKCKDKFVDPCTKEQHSLTTSQQLSQTDLNGIKQPALSKELSSLNQLSSLSQQSVTTIDSLSDIERDDNELLSSLDIDNLSFLSKKRQQTSSAKINILNAEEQVITSADEKELAKGIQYSNINKFEDYSAPNIDYENKSQPRLRIPSSFDDILIWLLKFQSNFKVPETATEILIKYIRQLLCEFGDKNLFKNFPTSMYMLRKHLKIGNFITYSVCPKCNKLYTEKEIVDSRDNNRQLS
ncbi:20554_t:CDS:2, partial [Dentiscutata erythropus]